MNNLPSGTDSIKPETIETTAEILTEWLVNHFCTYLNVSSNEIDVRLPFAHYQIDSIQALSLISKLEQFLGRSLSPTLLWDYPSIATLVPALIGTEQPEVAIVADSDQNADAIAIIGMSCRFPGARNLAEYWDLLINGRDAITEIPAERWNLEAVYNPDRSVPGTMYTRWGGFVDQPDYFDAGFFGISPREAIHLDPQQRMLLECTWEAFEDAGQSPQALAGSKTGVFIASVSEDYGRILFSHPEIIDAYTGPGTAHSILANRLSYVLNLQGPSININTACSGSLVAIHMACQALQTGEADLVVAGGVNASLLPDGNLFFSKAGALSPDGRCKTFDARANGIVRSDGAGIVILKPLQKALADGNPIYAVIRGSAVNSDGRTNGIMAPNRQSQEVVLQEAYRRAGVNPATVQYIEAHGTGTSLGDVIEAQALGAVLAVGRSAQQPCALGSVKTNIGHSESAAGIAGVIKVALAMKHQLLPASLHFETPNPMIPFEELRLQVQAQRGPWPNASGPLLAGVSGFGFGGTNAHVVLESAPIRETQSPNINDAWPLLLPLSAQSEPALWQLAARYASQIAAASPSEVANICYSASVGRSQLDHRLAAYAASPALLAEQLNDFAEGRSVTGLITQDRSQAHKLVWVFSGQGSHWVGMGRGLLGQQPIFRQTLEACDQAFANYAGWSLIAALLDDQAAEQINQTDRAQPLIFALQVSLAALWRSWGITPAAIVGHSLGEVAAAYVSGVLTLDEAVQVVYHRSRLMKQVAGKGKTAAVELTFEQARLLLVGREQQVAIAGINSPTSCILAGDPSTLEQLVASLQHNDVFARLVRGVDIAFHSPQMEPLVPELNAALAQLKPQAPMIPLVSTVTGTFAEQALYSEGYWGRNLREPFLFATAIKSLLDKGFDTFLEVSPHPVLGESMLRSIQHFKQSAQVFSSLRRDQAELDLLFETLGRLFVAGYSPDWQQVYPEPRQRSALPNYPWQRERYWFDQLLPATSNQTSARGGFVPALLAGNLKAIPSAQHPLLGISISSAVNQSQFWQTNLAANYPAYLADHVVQEQVLLPGAAYVEMIIAALRSRGQHHVTINNLVFKQPLILPNQGQCTVQLVCNADDNGVNLQILSQAAEPDSPWELHATANAIDNATPVNHSAYLALDELQARCAESVAVSEHYARMQAVQLVYGPAFQSLSQIWRGEAEALAQLQLAPAIGQLAQHDQLHPALLDATFQLVAVMLAQHTNDQTYLPIAIERLNVLDRIPAEAWCHAVLRSAPADETLMYEADLVIADAQGRVVVEIAGLKLFQVAAARSANQPQQALYDYRWQPFESQTTEHPAERWLILANTHDQFAKQLSNGLAAHGQQVDCLEQSIEAASLGDWLKTQLQANYQQIVCLWPLAASNDQAPVASATQQSLAMLTLLQTLSDSSSATPRLWCVTRGAQAVLDHEVINLAQAPLWGMLRSAALEHPELAPSLIDLAPMTESNEATQLAKTLLQRANEHQQALRNQQQLVARLQQRSVSKSSPLKLSNQAAYLITGGSGGLGLEIAHWMLAKGASNLIILGRRPLQPSHNAVSEQQSQLVNALSQLEQAGANLRYAAINVADQAALAEFLQQYRAETGLAIRGIVHAAGVLDDQMLYRMEPSALTSVFAPKVAGAWALHEVFSQEPLDFMIFCSSLAASIGSVGQAHYAAANSFMDSLAAYRHSQGLAGLSINWGPWAEVGMAAKLNPQLFEAHGVQLLQPQQALVAMEQLINDQAIQTTIAEIDWATWLKSNQVVATLPFFAALAPSATIAQTASNATQEHEFRQRVLQTQPSERQALITQQLKQLIAKVMQLEPSKLDSQLALHTLGLDSIMAIELKTSISQNLGVTLSVAYLIQGPSIDEIVANVNQQLSLELSSEMFASPETRDDALQVLLEQVQQSDHDQIAQILAELEQLSTDEAKSRLVG
ncbi:MAG: SDR family NAD(P)-dependent oxidoreductase [Chloroflexi bacterium]|nr:SDR family NAD(P)-dependent oxidoreductase [Chloroflexota bacterium]